MSGSSQYENSTLIGNWYEDRSHRRTDVSNSSEPVHHIHRYRATPIAMDSPASCASQPPLQSHASEQYTRKQLIQPAPQPSFAQTATLHAAIERPDQLSRDETERMQRSRVLPPFNKQQTETRELSLSSHSAYGGMFADSAERRTLLPLVDWDEKEQLAAAEHFTAQRRGNVSSGNSDGSDSSSAASEHGSGKRCSGASGEQLQVGGSVDPSVHSFVQRSWLPHRQHFDNYCAERVTNVWSTVAEQDRKRDEDSRLARRGSVEAPDQRKRQFGLTNTVICEPFDRTNHAFTTSPAFAHIG